ncbi:ABC transporter substrate-binding protein [Lacisediminihabitans sp.]|uniref:ABC transporter substrate-binding protein n=1 Tax=Lacisediminihabitans sp. TaxID=2787631 RepID=UPI00374CB7FD
MFLSNTKSRGSALAIVGAAVALVLSGCAPSASSPNSAGGATSANTLVAFTGQAGDYQINFNPYSPSSIGGNGTIFESLFFVTNANTKAYKPLLGTSYKWNESGTELAITTRAGVKWSDGTPFTAHDVAFTLDLVKKTPAINTTGFAGTTRVADDTHLTIKFDNVAFVSGPSILGRLPIVPEHLWKGINPATDVMEKPVGTGAYRLTNFKAQAYTLSANEKYWGGAPKVKAIRFLSLSGNQAGADGLAAGTIDWQTGPVPDISKVSKTYPGYKSITIKANQVVLTTCSSAALGCTGPQTDVNVRKAVYYALDRKQVNSLSFQNTAGEVSTTFALTGPQKSMISTKVKDSIAPMTANPTKAESILTAAGWAKGSDGIFAKGGVPLSLTVQVVSGWTDYITALDTMAQQMKKAGIKLVTAQSSWNEWTNAKSKGSYQLAIDSLGQGPASDPYYLYSNYFSTANTAKVGSSVSLNVGRYSDQTVDAAIAAVAKINPKDTAGRQAQFDTIQQKISADMPYIPVLTGGTTSEWNAKKFTGWPTEGNLYAFPAVWASPDNAEIYKSLVPTGK